MLSSILLVWTLVVYPMYVVIEAEHLAMAAAEAEQKRVNASRAELAEHGASGKEVNFSPQGNITHFLLSHTLYIYLT